MHVLGKVFTWMIVVLALVAMVLTAKMHGVRNSYHEQVEDLKEQNERNATALAQRRRDLQDLRGELHRTLLGWDRYWNNVEAGKLRPMEGTISTENLGTDQGLGLPKRPNPQDPEPPVVHAFRPTDDGSYVYVGPFQTTSTLRENVAVLKSAWGVRGQEADSWNKAGTWRFWALVPSPYTTRFSDLQKQLTVADESLLSAGKNLDLQNQLAAAAGRDLKFRLGQLLRAPNVQPGEKDPELGLIKAIEYEVEERDERLMEVDQLRRELKDATETRDELNQENNRLADSLPKPKPALTPTALRD